MKKLLIIPILLICLTGASTRNVEPIRPQGKSIDKVEVYHTDRQVDKLDSLLKTL